MNSHQERARLARSAHARELDTDKEARGDEERRPTVDKTPDFVQGSEIALFLRKTPFPLIQCYFFDAVARALGAPGS